MKLAALLVALTSSLAAAQPGWSPSSGWDTRIPYTQDDVLREHQERMRAAEERARKMREDFEATSRRMDEDFERSSHTMLGFFLVAAGAMIVAAIVAARKQRRRQPEWTIDAASFAAVPEGTVDVSVLRIAIDGRASKFVRDELARLTKRFETTSADGRAKRLREVTVLLRRVRDAWVYGGAINEPMGSLADAKQLVAKHVDESRMRASRPATPSGPPARHEHGLVVVTLVVATHGELVTVSDIGAGEELRRALEAVTHREPRELIAVEVVWPEHTLSSIDLEALYPRPHLVPLHGALVGRVFCSYCGGPFPAELVSCPHCGAPAHGRPRVAS